MAFDLATITAYIENSQFPLIGAIQLDPKMTASMVTVQAGVKGSTKMHFLDTDVIWSSGTGCTRTASGTTTRTDKTLTVAKMQSAEDLCLADLDGKWDQIMLKQGATTGLQVLPEEIAKIYFEQKRVLMAQELDTSDWQGDTLSAVNNLSFYDGWIKWIDAGSAVAGNTAAVNSMDAAKIIPALQGMFLLIPPAIRNKSDLKLFLPQTYYDLYVIALINANLFHFAGKDGESKLFGTNITLVPTFGLTGVDRMFLTYASNLVLGIDGEGDQDFIYRVDPVTNVKILVDTRFTRGTQVMFVEDVVEWSFANS